jgi:class 3 adenylate cyclase/tetratricopeptide (TPR) repeat protein
MKCPQCTTENPDDNRFCRQCGAGLLTACPRCDAELLPDDRFCGACGHDLRRAAKTSQTELGTEEKLAKLKRYLPESLTERILAQRDKIEGERKQVTVMFCDMEGFTRLTERLGPEEAYGIMDRVYEILISRVHEFEGTVNEMTGDGIMALFGAPIALEDAPQRAIRAGQAIHREMARLGDTLRQERPGLPQLKMRIGIHTGPVVVGTLGNDLRVDFKAVGDTVNLASRMEGLAEPGATYVTEDTFRLTEGFFRFEALGAQLVKGRDEPVKTYRVIAPSPRRTRFDITAERGLTPFVGRERELELLLDGFERARSGRGQAFSVIAEAGVGKSRLLYEFRKAVAGEDVTFGEGRCLSYSRGVAYHPLIDIITTYFDITDGDRDAGIRKKVERGLAFLGINDASTLPYFLELLSFQDTGVREIPLSPDAKKARIVDALRRFSVRLSELRPLVMAFEDLHWIDDSSEEAAKSLLDSIAGTRTLLILTYRPEYVHTWGTRSYHSQLNLNRLSNRESLTMASHLLGTEDLDPALEELILEKTEGVPFFIEEFIQSLKDLEIVREQDNRFCLARDLREVTIPSTIQDVIMARVDAMPDGARELLRVASVIDREFSYDLIARITDIPEPELLVRLSTLKDAELIHERGIYPDSTYVFRHALTRELLYDSILTGKKKQLHERIGRAIEVSSVHNIDQHYAVLAEHFTASGDFETAAKYSKLASKKDLEKGSYLGAINYCKKRISCLEKLPRSTDIQKDIIEARTRLAMLYNSLSRLHEARDAVTPIADLAHDLDYTRMLPGIHEAIGAYHLFVEEDFQTGFQHLENVFQSAEEIKDDISVLMPAWFASYHVGLTLSLSGKFETGLQYFRKCSDLSASARDITGLSFAKGMISLNAVLRGDLGAAKEASDESLRMAEEVGGLLAKAMGHSAYGTCCYFLGLFEESEHHLLKALEYSEKITQVILVYWGPLWLGFLYSDIGEYGKAEKYHEKGISSLKDCKIFPSMINVFEVSRARGRVLNGDLDVNLLELIECQKRNRFKAFDGLIMRYLGEIFLNMGTEHIVEAETWLRRSIDTDEHNKMKWFLAGDHVALADLFEQNGDEREAQETLRTAIGIFKECGADGWVSRTERRVAMAPTEHDTS